MSLLNVSVSSIQNPNVANNNSWLKINTDTDRAIYAQAVYTVPEQSDIEIVKDTAFHYGNYNKIVILESTVFSNLTANRSVITSGLNATFPVNFQLESFIQGFKLTSGAVIAYK
jgi:hypothetical protein